MQAFACENLLISNQPGWPDTFDGDENPGHLGGLVKDQGGEPSHQTTQVLTAIPQQLLAHRETQLCPRPGGGGGVKGRKCFVTR